MMERRKQLGGSIPRRVVQAKGLTLPGDDMYRELKQGAKNLIAAQRWRRFRLLRDWVKNLKIGHRIVPIAPDEYCTVRHGLDVPERRGLQPGALSSTSRWTATRPRRRQGSCVAEMLHEGISEAGAMASAIGRWIGVLDDGEPMIPFNIFHSMLGFQRTGRLDLGNGRSAGPRIPHRCDRWNAPRRTGEGLQHADGDSRCCCDQPGDRALRPAFAYEVGHVMCSGLERMYGSTETQHDGETLPRHHRRPSWSRSPRNPTMSTPRASCAASTESQLARPTTDRACSCSLLEAASPGSPRRNGSLPRTMASRPTPGRSRRGTSRPCDATQAEEWELLHPDQEPRTAYITDKLAGADGPVVAVSDWTPAPVPLQVARWVPGDVPRPRHRRVRLRRHPTCCAGATSTSMPRVGGRSGPPGPGRRRRDRQGQWSPDAFAKYRIDDLTAVADRKQEGGDA